MGALQRQEAKGGYGNFGHSISFSATKGQQRYLAELSIEYQSSLGNRKLNAFLTYFSCWGGGMAEERCHLVGEGGKDKGKFCARRKGGQKSEKDGNVVIAQSLGYLLFDFLQHSNSLNFRRHLNFLKT